MYRRTRAALALAALLVLAVVPPASARSLTIDELTTGRRNAQQAVTASASPAPCADRAYNLDGGRWKTPLRWSFRAASTPASLSRRAARITLKRSFANIVNARNDCGRADRVSATAQFLGRTTRKPRCTGMDGHNVVGFRPLASDVLARTCWWTVNGRIVEADIQINSTIPWATSLAGCQNRFMLEAVVTHEVGHAYGVGHVGEKKHGRLTMSTQLDGPCNNQEATLGLGDLLALEALY